MKGGTSPAYKPFTAPLSPALKKGASKSNNNSNENEIHVQLGAPSYTCGDVVTGVVLLHCKSPISPHSVGVKIKGIERLWWQNTKVETINNNGRKETKTTTEDINSDKEFFCQKIVLEAPPSVVAGQQYSFPFLYKLPPTIPASFFEEGGNKQQGDAYSCKILYKVKTAVFLAPNHKPVLKETSWIVVNEAVDVDKKLPSIEGKKSLVAFSGSITAKASMDRHVYTPGETALSKVKVNNTSVKPTKFVRMSVTKYLDLQANGAEKRVQQKVFSQEFPGQPENFYGVMWLPFNLPVALLPSVSLSPNMKSHYLVNIEVDVPTTSELSVSLPLVVRVPDTFFSGMQVQPPPGPVPTTISIRPPWQSDDSASACQQCNKGFNLINRRHHCRHCGRVLCSSCCEMKSSVPKLGFASEVRVCAKCLPDASKGGIKKASGKQHMQEFYKLHPPPKATKAPPPPTKEETIAGVLKQVEAAEADCKTQNWAAVISRKTPLYTYIETNRQHLDNAFIDDAKARFTVCETEANRALFDEQVKSLIDQLEKLVQQAETSTDQASYDKIKSSLVPLLERAQSGPYAPIPALQQLVPAIHVRLEQWEANFAKGQAVATAQAKLKAIQQQLDLAAKESSATHFKNAKAALLSAGKLVAEVEGTADFAGFDFVPPAMIQFKAQISASTDTIASAKISFRISQIQGFVSSVDGMLGQSKLDDALRQVEQATQFLSKLNKYSNNAVATSFLTEGPGLISSAAEKCSSAKHTKEAEDKKSNFKTRIFESENYVKRDQFADAKEKLDQASSILHDLHHNFHKHAGVEEFVQQGKDRVDSVLKSIEERKFTAELTKKKDVIDIRLSEAEHHLKNNRYDDVNEKLDQVKAAVADLAVEPFATFDGAKTIAAKATERINKIASDAYTQKHENEARSKMDWITSLKDTAKNCIQRGDNGQATDKIDDARIKIAELDQPPLNTLGVVTKFIPETLAALITLESSIAAAKFDRLVKDKKETISNKFSQADNYIKRESWDSVTEMVEEARTVLNELSDPQYAAVPGLADYISQSLAKAQKFIDDSFSKKYGKDARDKMDYIKTLKGQAERHFGLGQWDQALDNIESTRTYLEKLNVAPLNQMADVIKFLAEVPAALDLLVEKVSSGRFGKEARNKMDYLKTLKGAAADHIKYSQWDQGVSKLEDCRTRAAELEEAPYNTLQDVVVFLKDYLPQIDNMLEQIRTGRFSKEAGNKMDWLKTLRSIATQNVKVDQWDQAIGKIEEARTKLGELDCEPYNTLPDVIAFLKDYPGTLDKLSSDIVSAKFGKQARNTMDWLKTLRSTAQQNVKVDQWDQAIGKIEEARTKMQDLEAEPYDTLPEVVEFLKDYPATLDKLSKEIVSAKYGKEARNKMEWLGTLRSIATQNVKVDQWDQALGKIEEARTKLLELDVEPYNTKLPAVIEFLKTYPPTLDKLEDDITSAKFGKEARNKMEWLGTLRSIATQNVKVDQWDQALGKIEEARTKLLDLDVEPYNTKLPAVIEFLKTYPPTLDKLEEDIVAAKFGKEARNKMEWLGTLRSIATQNVKVDQWDQALGKIEEARTKLLDLDVEPYNTKLPAVIEFLKEYPPTLTKLEEDIIVAKFSKEARNRMEWVGTLKGIAAQNVKNTQWDQALDKIEEARTKIQELDVEPYNTKLPAVIQFLKDIPPTLDALVDEITIGKFSRQARDKMDWLKTLKGQTEQNIGYEQWGQAIDKIEEARTKLQELDQEPFNTEKFPEVVQFLKDMPQNFTKFEEDIVIKKFSKEANSKMDWVKTLRGIAADNMEKDQWDQSSGKLEEARAILLELSQEPFIKVPTVVTFLEEIPATLTAIEDQITHRKFSKVARGKMEWLGTLEGVAEQSLENEQWDRALDQVEEARGILLEIGQEPYTKLEAVVNFTAEFAPKLDKIVTTVIERKFSKVAKNKMDWVNTLIGVAQQNVDLDQFDQGAGKIEEVRGIVDELSQEPFSILPTVESFVATKYAAIAALEKQLVEKKFSKLVKGKIDWIGTLKGVVQQNVKVDQFDQAIGKIEEARELLYEISQEPYDKIDFVVAFVHQTSTELTKIEEDIVAAKLSKVANNKMDWVKTLKGVAEQCVQNEQWDQAVGKFEEARTVLYELSQEMYLSIPAVGNFITNTEPIFYAIEEKMSENKFRKEANGKKDWLDTLRRLATDQSKVDNWDQALDKLEEARQIAYTLKQEPYSKLSDIVAFATQTEGALDTLERDIAFAKFGKAAKNKMDWAKTLKGVATDNVSKDQWDQGAQKLVEVRDILGELLQSPFSALPAVSEFTAAFGPAIDAIEKDLIEKRFAKVAKGRMEWAQTNYQIAKQSLEVDKWDDTFAKIELSRDILFELSQEPYTQLASVGPFVENTTRELNSLYNNTIEKKFSKEAKDKMEYVGTLTSTAGQFADKDQFDQAIGKIEEARDAINVLRQEPYTVLEVVNNFVGPTTETLNKIEAKIYDAQFNKKIRSKSEWVGTLLGVARQHIDVDQWGQALDKIEQLRTILLELQEEPFWSYPVVQTLVAETNPKLEALVQDIVEKRFGKEVKNKMDWVNTLKGVASQFAENGQWEQALEKIEAALQIIFELTQEPFNKLPAAGEFCQNIKPEFEKIQTAIAEKKIAKAARNKMDYVSTLKSTASDNQEKEQWDQALDKIESARQVIFELSQEPYNILAYVTSFIAETTSGLDKIDQLIVENKFAKVARNKTEWVTTLINVAKDFVSKDAWDMGLGKVEEARGILSELAQEPFTKLPAVVTFVTDNTPTLDKIEQSVVEAKFAKQTRAKLDRVAALKHQVKTWIERENWDTAFQDIENARQVLFELNAEPYNKLPVAIEFVKETSPVLAQFEDDIVQRKLSRDTRNKMEWVGTLIGTSNNMLFREHWDAAYEKLYEARDILESLNREPYTQVNGVTAFVAENVKVIEKGELQIVENKYNKEAKNRVQYFGTLKQIANEHVQKEQWDQALDKLEAARQVVSDLNEGPYNKLQVVITFVGSSPLTQLEQIEQQVIERKFAKVVKGKIEWVNTLKGVARDCASKEQWNQALDKLEELRAILTDLSEEPFNKLPASNAVVATETPEIAKIQQQIFERKFAKEVQGKMEWARTLLNTANQFYEKDQWDQALSKIEEGREILSVLKEDPYNQLSTVPKFVQEVATGFDNTTQRIIEAKFSKEARNKQEYIGTLRDVANQNIQHEQWDQALENIESARAALFELQQEPFSQIPAIANFRQTSLASLEKADQTIIEAKFTKDAFSKMEWVGTLSRIAADNTRLDQWDQATGKLEEARQALYVLSQEPYNKLPYVNKFVETSTATLNNTEQQIIEKKFAKESKNKMDWASTLKSTASSFLFREQWDGALEKIEEAKSIVSELSQEPYSKLPFVVKFTQEISPALEKFVVQVNEQKFGKEAKNKVDYLSTLKGAANDFMSKEQWDQALDNLEKARTLLSELSEEPYSTLPAVQNTTKDTSAALDRIDQQIVERKFNKVAKGKMKWAITLKDTAKQSVDVDHWDPALSKLEDMRTVLDELSEDPFSRLSVVTNFVEKERPQLAKIEQLIVERKFSKEVQSKIEWLGTIVGIATQNLETEQWDQAVSRIEEGRSVLSTLSEEPFNKLPASTRAVSKYQALLDKIEQQVTENKFGKEARNKQEYLGTLRSVAQDFLQKDQFDSALHQVEAAKQVISELTQEPYSKLPAIVKHAQDTLVTLAKIEQDVATTKFAKISRDKMDYVGTLLSTATGFVQKSQFDQGTQQLEQARQSLTELSEDPFDKLPIVVKFVANNTASVAKLEQQIVETKFNKEAKNKMDYAASLKSTASSYLFREMWDQANTKIEEAKGILTELSQDPYNKLPAATAFVAELSPNLVKVQQQIAETRFGKEARGKVEFVGTLKGNVTEFINNAQYDQAIGKLEEARTFISELDQLPFNLLAVVQKCVKEQTANFDKQEQQIIEKKFLQIAKDKMSYIITLKGVTRDALTQENWDKAFQDLSTARTAIVELSEDPYTKLPVCVTFVQKENGELDKIEQKIVEQKFGKEAKNKMEYASTLRSSASEFSQKEQWDQALGKLEEANTVVAELKEEPFNKLSQVNNFVQTIVQALAKIEQQVIERKFSKLAKDKIDYSNTLRSTAGTFVEQEQWGMAAEKIEACRTSIQELSEEPFNKLPHIVRFTKDQAVALDRLEQEISEKRYAKEAKDKMEWANTLKGVSADFAGKNQWDSAFEKIEEGRKVLDELNQPPFNKISAVLAFIGNFTTEFEKLETAILSKKLGKVADDKVSWARTCLNNAGQALSISGYDKCLGEIEKAREVFLELDSPPLNKLQEVAVTSKELKDRAGRLEAQAQEKKLNYSFDDKVSYINSLHESVPTFINQGNNGRAADELEKVRGKIEELAEPPYRLVAAFQARVKELRKKTGQLEAKLGTEIVKKVVTDKISKAQFYLGEAEKKGASAFENVEKARDILQELAEPAFKSVDQVVSELPTLQSKLSTIGKYLASSTVSIKPAAGQLVSPSGPISDIFGPWIPHVESGMVSGIKPEPKAPTDIRAFIHKWNPAVDEIARKWKRFVTAIYVEGDRLEKLYATAGRGEQNWRFNRPYEETDKLMDQLRKDIYYVADKPTPDPTGLTDIIIAQHKEAVRRWNENKEHLENVYRLTDGIKWLLGVRHRNLLFESSYSTPASYAKSEINEIFGRTRGLYLGPIQDDCEERIRLIAAYQATFHEGRVHGYIYKSSREMTHLDFKLDTVARYIYLFRHTDKLGVLTDQRKCDEPAVRKALKTLEPYPQIYKIMIEKFEQCWEKDLQYYQYHKYKKGCELEWWEVAAKPSPLVFDLKFLIEEAGMAPFDPVSPGTPEQSGLPFQSPGAGYKAEFELSPEQEKLYAGKFIFSAEGPIGNKFVKAESLGTSFVLSKDFELHARAFWPNCIGNYAIGKSKLTGAPYYVAKKQVGTNCNINRIMYITAKIDGKEVKPLTSVRQRSIAWDHTRSVQAFQSKSYGYTPVGSKFDSERNTWDNWGLGKRRLMKYLIDAGPGKHTVELSLHFTLIGDNIWDQPLYEHSATWISLPSHPLAVGSFDIEVPEAFEIPDNFPTPNIERTPFEALNTFYEKGGYARLPASLIWVTQDSDWYLFKAQQEITEFEERGGRLIGHKRVIPPVYAKNYCCLVYFNPEKGWKSRECVREYINVVTAIERRDWKNLDSVYRDDYGGAYFEVEYLPKSLIAEIPDRCSEENRFATTAEPF